MRRTLLVVTTLAMGLFSIPALEVSAATPPATYYGTSGAGDSIEARYNDVACAAATAGADGFWQLTVTSGGACGISEGATLAFYRNGADSGARETFRPGGVPANIGAGVAAGGAPSGVPTPAPAPAGPKAFSGSLPPSGGAALLVTAGDSTPDGLRSALGGAGCKLQAIAVLRAGSWLVYIQGAPGVVNAAFPGSLPATSAFFVRC